jgi:hypothetical protein
MSFESNLRTALVDAKNGKDVSRQAGEGVWANYVRSTCYPQQSRDVESFEAEHKALVERLNDIRELSKEEKNSLRSAKCIVAKAITNNVDVWQRDDIGQIKMDESLNPMPKGKSELQESKTDFQRMMGFIDQATKKWESDTRDVFTKAELSEIWSALANLADSVYTAKQDADE